MINSRVVHWKTPGSLLPVSETLIAVLIRETLCGLVHVWKAGSSRVVHFREREPDLKTSGVNDAVSEKKVDKTSAVTSKKIEGSD